jgi:hypothetical protein
LSLWSYISGSEVEVEVDAEEDCAALLNWLPSANEE